LLTAEVVSDNLTRLAVLSEIFTNSDLNWKIKAIIGQYQILQNSTEMSKVHGLAQNSMAHVKLWSLVLMGRHTILFSTSRRPITWGKLAVV